MTRSCNHVPETPRWASVEGFNNCHVLTMPWTPTCCVASFSTAREEVHVDPCTDTFLTDSTLQMPIGYAKIRTEKNFPVMRRTGLVLWSLFILCSGPSTSSTSGLLQLANASKRLSSAENLKHTHSKLPSLQYVDFRTSQELSILVRLDGLIWKWSNPYARIGDRCTPILEIDKVLNSANILEKNWCGMRNLIVSYMAGFETLSEPLR